VHRALADDGRSGWQSAMSFAAELKMIAQREVGFHCRSWVIWYYTSASIARGSSTARNAHLFHFVKDSKHFTFNFADPAIRVPSARQLVYAERGRIRTADCRTTPGFSARRKTFPMAFPGTRYWYFPRVAGTFKEAGRISRLQMPERLLGRIIRASSNRAISCSTLRRSGSTLIVARKLDRKWVGFELSEDYAKKVRERLEKVRVDEPLDGAEDPLTSAPSTTNGKQLNGTNGHVRTPRRSLCKAGPRPDQRQAALPLEPDGDG